MDFFTPVVGEEAQHPYFRGIWKQANGFNCDVLNEWARGFKDRDGKFVKEFQTTFDSSFWELYLFAVMKQFQLEVDFSFTSPDFFITNHCGKFRTPGKVRPLARRLAGEPRTAVSHPSPNTPSTASLPPKKGKSVTYVSGTLCYLCLGSLTSVFN